MGNPLSNFAERRRARRVEARASGAPPTWARTLPVVLGGTAAPVAGYAGAHLPTWAAALTVTGYVTGAMSGAIVAGERAGEKAKARADVIGLEKQADRHARVKAAAAGGERRQEDRATGTRAERARSADRAR